MTTREKAIERGFTQYRKKQIAELRPYQSGESTRGISLSDADVAGGSPKIGDMIARNPKNHDDQWLVAAQYFADNFEPAVPVPPDAGEDEAAKCESCGGPAFVWFAPNDLWNLVKGGHAKDDPGGMLCPNCFIRAAEKKGIVPTAWIVCREDLAIVPQRDAVIDECIAAVRAEASRRRTVAAALSSIAAPDEHHAQLTGEETAGNIEAALVALKSHPAPPAQDERGAEVERIERQINELENNYGQGSYRDGQNRERIASLQKRLAELQASDHLPAKAEG